MKTFTFKLQKTIKTNVSSAFTAFTDASLLSKWFTTNAKVDLRVGGRYSNDDHDEGEYLEIKKNKLVKFTWENKSYCPGTIVTVYFDTSGKNKTIVRLIHSRLESSSHVKDMKLGWMWALYNVKLFLETGKTVTHDDWLKNIYGKKV